MTLNNLKIISAGAGSGKTYRLTQEMVSLLKKEVRASGIIATTFTKKAAAELEERVRVKLLEEGMTDKANDLANALIGTVHGLGVKLLRRFAFEAGVSPEVDIMADEDQQVMFNNSLSTVLPNSRIKEMELLADRLGLNKKERYDWRREVKSLTDVARANDFDIATIEKSKQLSFESFVQYLDKVSPKSPEAFNKQLMGLLEEAITRIDQNEDATKVTQTAKNTLRGFLNALKFKSELNWHEWVKISKIKVGAKSRDDVADLMEFAQSHIAHPDFHKDIESFLNNIFDIAIDAIREYEAYKKQRGLIDYIDMESIVNQLLNNKLVQEVLREELDLLMVDEFQDTSPIQLEIFLKLSKIAKHSIWVGDPKQSIYGFRGADPKLMLEIIRQTGGIKQEDIQINSWRSREDIVYATNSLFTKAFDTLPKEQVALQPKRKKLASADSQNEENEPIDMGDALMHWHFQYDGEGRRLPGKPWMENCIADSVKKLLLDRDILIYSKEEKKYRKARPGDIAILCRSNMACADMAKALHKAGLKAAISRSGLLNTAEAKLILACLKFILHRSDSLSVAEILLLASNKTIEEIIDDRLLYLEKLEELGRTGLWAEDDPLIDQLNTLRGEIIELSSAEILNLIIEELDLRRIIAGWGKVQQRFDNVDVLRKFALNYEEACNRLHSAASLGGFLLWLNELDNEDKDMQGSGENKDAVNVLTYHKSKGLEWPIVICHNLEGNLRDSIWGMNIISETETVDLKNILGNRWLRYWINPYSDQFRNTVLEERINASPVKKAAHDKALEEEARVMYVGITRARDYLIFPTRQQPTKWLNRIWHKGQADHPTLDPNSPETPWDWEGNILFAATEVLPFPKEFPHADTLVEEVYYLEERTGKKQHIPYHIDLSKENFHGEISASISSKANYVAPILLEENADSYTIAKMIKAFLTADNLDYALDDRLAMATAFIERYELVDMIGARALVQQSNAYFEYLSGLFNHKTIYKKYPIRYFRAGRLFETIIDIIVETDNGLILIQNSGFVGEEKKWKNKALELSAWMHLSKTALQQIFKQEKIKTYVHFVLDGGLIELKTKELVKV